jgi:CubicO group peptidase (beta-lactamase class C family)
MRSLSPLLLSSLIGCGGSDPGSGAEKTASASDPILVTCPKGYMRVCYPGEGPGGTTVCDCEPGPNLSCESDLISAWQQSMPSLGYASSQAAQAIDQAILGQLNVAGFNHPQFVGGRWPGMTVAITQGSRLVFAKSYGFAEMQGPQWTHPDDLFRLASDSKQLTGATILKLIANGQSVDGTPNNPLTLDSEVFQILSSPPNAILPPGGLAAINPALQNITVREVLEHTGGWAYNIGDPVWYAYNVPGAILPVTETNVVEYMEQQAPSLSPPGVTFSYSNFGYNLLATLITKITGQDYESVVKEQVLAPLGITRTQVGNSLYSTDGEVNYYAYYNSPSAMTLFPGQTSATISGDQNIPYGTWSLEAGRGAGGWIASSIDMLRFQIGVNGRGNVQVYPNIVADILSQVGQPSQSFDGSHYSSVDPSTDRYMAGWGVHWWGPPYNGFELDHGGGVNGGGSYTESIPDAPGVVGYGIAAVINTSATPGTQVDGGDAVRNAMLGVLASNNGSLLDPTWSADTDFFDQHGAFDVSGDATTTNAGIAAAANGCTYNGQTYTACYASRLEGVSGSTPTYRAQIVPLHSGDAARYVLGATCTQYVSARQSAAADGYQPVNLQWYPDVTSGLKHFQAVWVKINH